MEDKSKNKIMRSAGDTIYALSSAHGMAGVAIVRVSGPLSLKVAQALTGREKFKSRYAYFSGIYIGEEIIDTALVLYFENPNSFTGEDVLEIQCHGSRAVLERVYAAIEDVDDNIRPAKAGEFTERAVENGKMDLVQAEGLLDLIHAKTETQRKQARAIQDGSLSNIYTTWRKNILELLMYAEADIDFSDDPLPPHIEKTIKDKTTALIGSMEKNLANPKGEKIREGISVALIGKPNAGKSTLFNRILGREASIISSIPGTTRDVVEATMDIKGYEVCFADTAGLRETANTIEQEGVRRALAKAEAADIKILLTTDIEDAHKEDKNTLVVLNKSDEQNYGDSTAFVISAKTGEGVDGLVTAIEKRILDLVGGKEDIGYANARHVHYLKRAKEDLEKSLNIGQVDLRAEHIRFAANALGELVGAIQTDEILAEVFSSFCIGK